MIQFFHVSKRYPGGQAALDDVTFEIARGEFCFLTGAERRRQDDAAAS